MNTILICISYALVFFIGFCFGAMFALSTMAKLREETWRLKAVHKAGRK